jgi:hypothetical protein
LPRDETNPRRWTLQARRIGVYESGAPLYGDGAIARGPSVPPGESVDAMPVSEHESARTNWEAVADGAMDQALRSQERYERLWREHEETLAELVREMMRERSDSWIQRGQHEAVADELQRTINDLTEELVDLREAAHVVLVRSSEKATRMNAALDALAAALTASPPKPPKQASDEQIKRGAKALEDALQREMAYGLGDEIAGGVVREILAAFDAPSK